MKVAKSLLLGSAAVLLTVAGAQAADLPTRKAAPVQYVKICDAYGAGFFYIPGTDTCLRVGGLVLADWAVSNTPNKYTSIASGGTVAQAMIGGGALPVIVPGVARDAVATLGLGRVELDARTQSPWGTVRTFLRVESQFGSGQTAATGGMPSAVLFGAGVAAAQGQSYAAKDVTFLSKGFIQFAGITMGRIQSMFDFYADQVGYTALRGSNQTVNGLAYTATFGGGFSATLAVEDSVSHRNLGSVTNVYGATFPFGAYVQYAGTRLPDVVANLRVDQPWGSAQLSGAIHRAGSGLYNTTNGPLVVAAPGVAGPLYFANTPISVDNSLGFAVQGGLKFNLSMLSPGDVLWLQATYAKGAVGYVTGSNFAFVNGVDTSTGYGSGLARVSSGNGWNMVTESDCIWTYSGSCEKSSGLAVTAALRHYWTPTVSSTLSGNYYHVTYSQGALNPSVGALLLGGGLYGPIATNYTEFTLASGLEWNPVAGFGIGAELAWQHGVTSRPVNLAQDGVLMNLGFPAFKSQADLIRGRVRMYRAF